jgi:hypothetical protein
MTKTSVSKCRKCGKNAHEISGYLKRMNLGEIPSIWECAPSCGAKLSDDDKLLAAIEGDE